MLFSPKNSKYKKHQKGTLSNKVINNICISKNSSKSLKLVATTFGSLSSTQLVAIRFLIKKFIKKKGIIKFNLFPQRSVSKKPSEIRMGKGKGNFSYWSADIKVGFIICEIFCKSKYTRALSKMLTRVQVRLPFLTKIKI